MPAESKWNWRQIAILPLGLALWLAVFWRGPLINDVAWQLWIGRRLNEGALLYRDILEINPPWWFWLAAGLDRTASVVGISSFHLLLCLFATVAFAAVLLCRRLGGEQEQWWRAAAGLVAALAITSPFALGQREQFVLIAVLPYVLVVAHRAERMRVTPGLALTAGLLAASGLLLKHYFLLVPLALEVWLMARRCWSPWRPEVLALGAAGLIYGAAILRLTPAYLDEMVPLIRTAYHGYELDLGALLATPTMVAAVAGSLAVLASAGAGAGARAAAIGSLAFAASALWQAKGFPYHFVPALGLMLISLSLALPSLRRAGPVGKAAAAVAIILSLVLPWRESPRPDAAAADAVAGLPSGATVMLLSASGAVAWPLVWERDLDWPSRHMTLWMLAAVWSAEDEGLDDPALARLGAETRREMARDIARSRPAVILVDSRYDRLTNRGVLGYFLAEPSFAAAMRDYRRQQDSGYLQVFRRTVP